MHFKKRIIMIIFILFCIYYKILYLKNLHFLNAKFIHEKFKMKNFIVKRNSFIRK